MKKVGFIVLYTLICMISVGYSQHFDESEAAVRSNNENDKSLASLNPLILPSSSFHSYIGWLNNHEILYAAQIDQLEYHIISYNICTAQTKIVLSEQGSLTQASLSPSKQSLLLHKADSTLNAEVSVFNLQTKEKVWSHVIESYELLYEWNEHDESKILFTAFESDWTYKVWLADINKKEWEEITGTPPFIAWSSLDKFVYQQWSSEINVPEAPVYEHFFDIDYSNQVKEAVLAFDLLQPFFMTVELGKEEKEFSYTFDREGEIISTFTAPSVQMYSDWVIPKYDFIKSENTFITFKPYKDGEYNTEENQFALVSWDVEASAETVIKDYVNNEPLSCSPDGAYCLMGFQYTSIIDMIDGDLERFLIFEEEIQ
ncbi:hypothetical protein [Jeotgalibacillus marinus]|uniref:YqgU-like 6-bladed beta-propeller domain-containing protein n=1 Tax=Jeotgalibacillus marinus TaxID=86667 RepID=A0ABV3PZ85_9BACL